MISRVNMVIVGAYAIMANGGVIAPVGINMIALAAKWHAVPFVVAGNHEDVFFCPLGLVLTKMNMDIYFEYSLTG